MVKFSLIMLIYDNDIKDCFNSIINQTLNDFEVFYMNYSDNNPNNILNLFSKNNTPINIISPHDSNLTNLINQLKGEYVLFLYGNEIFKKDSFEILYNNLKKYNADMAIFNYNSYNTKDKLVKRRYLKSSDGLIDENNKNHVLNRPHELNSKAFEISFINETLNYPNYDVYNDIIYNLKSLFVCENISYVSKSLFEIKQSGKKYLNNDSDNLKIFDIMNEFEKFLKENNYFKGNEHVFLRYKLFYEKEVLKFSSKDFKKEFYNRMRQDFIEMNLSDDVFKKIPLSLYSFYIKVLNEKNFNKFKYFNRCLASDLKSISLNEVSEKFNAFDEIGIQQNSNRENKIIISLTSFPERMDDIHLCIYSILNQSLKPDEVILWLSENEYPNKENDLPDTLLTLKNNGLTIKWCSDIKSYKKLIPTLKEYPNDFIVTADDDIYYHENWLKTMWETYQNHPHTIISSRPRLISFNEDNSLLNYKQWELLKRSNGSSYLNFPTGAGGTMYFPNALSDVVFEEDLFQKLCPTTDDIWFWAMAILNKNKITVIDKPYYNLTYINLARDLKIIESKTLWSYNNRGHNNDKQMNNVLNYFPEIYKIIIDEAKER